MDNPNKHLKVEILSATERDPVKAAAILIFTKSTRLQMDGSKFHDVWNKCHSDPEWMEQELGYMAKTIRSSWEFLDVTFAIKNVSRACAQQITRTRFTPIDGDLYGSYAMQSQRVTDMSNATWHNPIRDNGNPDDQVAFEFDEDMKSAINRYKMAIGPRDEGGSEMKLEDARGLLPVNLHCSLVAKYNLRLLADLIQARQSYRAQGEFNQLAAEMRKQLVEMWPWAEMFLRPRDEIAKDAMEDLRSTLRKHLEGRFSREVMHDIVTKIAKVDDLMQGGK